VTVMLFIVLGLGSALSGATLREAPAELRPGR
jgi:hypothetical protein